MATTISNREEQHHLLGKLVYDLNETFYYEDLAPLAQLDLILSKIDQSIYESDMLGLNNTKSGLESIYARLQQLSGMQKKHLIPARIKDIINDINW